MPVSTSKRPPSFKRKKSTAKDKPKKRLREESIQPAEDSTNTLEEDESQGNQAKKKVRWNGSVDEREDVEDKEEDSEAELSAQTDQVCMATWCQNGRIGCAYHDPTKGMIYVLEDTEESTHFDLTKMLLEHTDPEIVLTSSKADERFMEVLRDAMDASGGVFRIQPHKDFVPAKGRDRLLSLSFLSELVAEEANNNNRSSSDIDHESGSEPRNAYDFMRRRREVAGDPAMKRWNASIRLSNFAALDSTPLCISSVGALLDHLTRERAVSDLEDEGIGGLEITGIEAIALDQVMHINADALSSLQIFENESHASVHSDRTKEGLSLFGILNNTRTQLGRSLLRHWFLHPSLSIPIITARHDAVAGFLRPENLVTANAMHNHLKGIRNIPRILTVMRAGRAGVTQWSGLVKFTFHTAMLREALSELSQAGGVEVVKKLIVALDVTSFREIGSAVNETIDWEESTIAGRVCVRPHIDEQLDNRKHIYHGIDDVLSKVAQKICVTVPDDYATSLNVVYFPQLGFLICVPMQDEWKTEDGIKTIDGWIYQFSSENNVYFKSQEMHDMDTHIGDLHSAIVDRELEIIQELLEKILVYEDAITLACDVCAELDCLLSFAEASRAYEYRRPSMSEDNVIEIHQGRHPLQEHIADVFVPNDIFVMGGIGSSMVNRTYHGSSRDDSREEGREATSVIVCTGANACGKSVYLKQAALIQFMAQIGCFVPAESATLGIVDKIFTRIQTRESVSKVQSAFMIDLNQVSLALRNCTPRSLIILDEFGKGTVSTDGAGLFCGVITHLLRLGEECPKVLCATHFYDVFRRGQELFDESLIKDISFLHMQVILTDSQGEVLVTGGNNTATSADEPMDGIEPETERRIVRQGESITYLYRVAEGLSFESHAAKCAELFGIPRKVVERAQYVNELQLTHDLAPLLDEEMSQEEKQELMDAESVCRRFLEWNFDAVNDTTVRNQDVKARLRGVLGRSE